MNLSQCHCADPSNALEGGDSKSPQVRNSLKHPLCQLGNSDMRDEVCRSLKKWNQTVRDQLREETRFKFVSEGGMQSVPIRVVDGVPYPFSEILEDIDPALLKLLLNRGDLEAGRRSLRIVQNDFAGICEWINQQVPDCKMPEQQSIVDTTEFTKVLLKALSEIDLEKRFKRTTEDPLGAYFFMKPKIELYWIPIALTAKLIKVSAEALTVVVLAHELAHAYTHLGYDIDGQAWPTRDFSRADLNVVEGLAQFYTSVVTRNLSARDPDPREAYEAFLKLQGGPYLVHETWGDDDKIREVVRGAMNETRARSVLKYEEFGDLLCRHSKQLGRDKSLKLSVTGPEQGGS
jgi:hypothetical protein